MLLELPAVLLCVRVCVCARVRVRMRGCWPYGPMPANDCE
jgi:hypothetical protein